MKPNRRSQLLRLANVTFVAPVTIAMLSSSADALDITWNNTGTDFNAGASWDGGVPPGTADRAIFSTAAVTSPALSAPATIQGISFANSVAVGYTVSGSPVTLTSNGTGAASAIHTGATANSATNTNTISANIVLGGAAGTNQTISRGSYANVLELTGNISSTNALARFNISGNNGAPTYKISGNNTFTATTVDIGYGDYHLNSSTAFGNAANTINHTNNTRFYNTSGGPVTIANNQTVGSPFTFNNANTTTSSDLTFSGNLNLTGERTIGVGSGGGKLILQGVNVGTTRQTKSGGGVLRLEGPVTGTGANAFALGTVSYSGYRWRVTGGSLEVASAAVLGDTLDLRAGLQAGTSLTGANKLTSTIVMADTNASITGENDIELGGPFILNNVPGNRSVTVTNTGTTTFSGPVSITDLAGDATQTLTMNVDFNAGATVVSGVIQNLAGGAASANPMGFTKTGGGDLTLTNSNTLAGTLTVSGGRLIGTNSGAFGAAGNTINVAAGATLQPDGNKTYTLNGPLTVASGGTLLLGVGSTSGANDKISGSGAVTMNGALQIDLPLTNPPDGATFTLFTQPVTFNAGSFSVVDLNFFQWSGSTAGGVWAYDTGSGIYTFNQATRTLTFAADTEPDGLPDAWELTYFPGDLTKLYTGGDFDGDGYPDEQEYAGGSNPKVAASVPGDVDGDALADSWEYVFYPGNLTQLSGLGGADKDGDGSSDLAEFTSGSSPVDSTWKPNQASLKHRWSFTTGANQLKDSVGNSDAVVVNGTTSNTNPVTFAGNAVTLAGGTKADSQGINLGAGLISEAFPVTVELWATENAVRDSSRIVDFGANSSEYLYMRWTQGTSQTDNRLEWVDAGVTSGLTSTTAPYTVGKKYHIVMTLTPAAFTDGALTTGTRVTWYRAEADGPSAHRPLWTQRGTFDTTNNLVDLADTIAGLGLPVRDDNPVASATYDEVRIWHGVLSETEREVAQAVGTEVINVSTDADLDGMVDSWEAHYGLTSPTAQGDADGSNNLEEFVAHSNPVATISTPTDRDGDGLDDENFEIAYFGDLDEIGTGDFDNDFANNELEETSGTDPRSAFNWPDTEDGVGDALNDGWEERYFGDGDGIVEPGELAQTATDDTDGDGEDNITEYTNGTNPANPLSRAILPAIGAIIDATKRNGSFELLGSPPGAVNAAKAAHWDNAGAGDVTYWTEWLTQQTAQGNSGTETLGSATDGTKRAYMQSGNAVYNLTEYIADVGRTYWLGVDKVGAEIDFYLVYQDAGGVIQPIPGAVFSSPTGVPRPTDSRSRRAARPSAGRSESERDAPAAISLAWTMSVLDPRSPTRTVIPMMTSSKTSPGGTTMASWKPPTASPARQVMPMAMVSPRLSNWMARPTRSMATCRPRPMSPTPTAMA